MAAFGPMIGQSDAGTAVHLATLADGAGIDGNETGWIMGFVMEAHEKGILTRQDLDGLETNRLNQLVVHQTLQTTRDPNVFAIGDCASCPWPEKNSAVPPRAQAAHQQASHLARWLPAHIQGKPIRPWTYRDFGSLVSLGAYSTVGSLMGAITRGSLMIEGYFAKLMYISLHKMHEYALHGAAKVLLDTLARVITRRTQPHVKLH